jgi:hypothetical protein
MATEYEKLVAEIYQGMLEFDGFETLRVEHNVKIKGKSGATHQIDVFWEFKAAGTTYRTCVECKNYKSSVKKLHVAAFAAVLKDIGNSNGIIATTSSFQKGAKLLAEENNIRLVLVNYLIKSIHLYSTSTLTDFKNLKFFFDEILIKKYMREKGLETYQMNRVMGGDEYLLDAEGNNKLTLDSLMRSKLDDFDVGINTLDCSGLYLDFEDIGLVEVLSIELEMTKVQLPTTEDVIESPNSARAIIEDIVNNNIHYLHDDGKVNNDINNI